MSRKIDGNLTKSGPVPLLPLRRNHEKQSRICRRKHMLYVVFPFVESSNFVLCNPHQSTEINLEGNNIHTLSLPAFREQQSSTTSETAMTPSKKQVATTTGRSQFFSSAFWSSREWQHWSSPFTRCRFCYITEETKMKNKTAQQPTTSLSTPTNCSNKSTKKQITHVLSDDEDDCDENAVITTSWQHGLQSIATGK